MKLLQLRCCLDIGESQCTGLEVCSTSRESKPSTSEVRNEPVICVRDACKSYGFTKNPLVVLNGLNMTVPKGVIYGLLGASGCGKTTLLSCILGQRKLNSGKIWVLGEAPGAKSSIVPKPRIGYMPQQTALYGDFTIYETFVYFGWIAGMTKKQIVEKVHMLSKLFMLPDTSQQIKTLSGGEQRRISLASVLLHEPELLVLDEPTVGVDPLLRENIWEHLLSICKSQGTTVIITTHYIEEARQADIVGIMRKGELLAEESPDKLLAVYQAETLEEVFLKLSVMQKYKADQNVNNLHDGIGDGCIKRYDYDIPEIFNMDQVNVIDNIYDYLMPFKAHHMKALIWKNTLWWTRNLPTLIYLIMLAIMLMAATCVCIGHDPQDLPIAVVNYETNNTENCSSVLTCNSTQLSCFYLEKLKKHSVVLTHYSSEEDAKQSVLRGQSHAFLVVKHNYSQALRARVDDWVNSAPWDIEDSSIDVFQDVYDKHAALFLKLRMYDTYQSFMNSYLDACDINADAVNVPIKWNPPVYGLRYPNFNDFLVPGVLLTMVFMLAILLTSCAMLIERSEANLERTFIMGITEAELIAAHIICEFGIMTFQSIFGVLTAFFIFDVTQRGSIFLVLCLSVITGLCGMNYGVLISCLCDTFIAVNLLAIGTFFPILFLSGVIWPIEGIHVYIRPFTRILPLTEPVKTLRSIIQKNWGFLEQDVYMGFISIGIWTILLFILSLLVLKYKKN